jgi:MFS family permease
VFGAGGGVGLVLSGVILEHLTWHWLFLIGAVPVLIATVLIARFVPESPIKTPTKPDYLGALTLSLALASLLIAISESANWGWTSWQTLSLLVLSALLFAAWVQVERRVPEPLVDLQTFGRREMAATNVATFVIGFSMFSAFILLPNFVSLPRGLPAVLADQIDYGFGATPVEVGLFFIPSSVAMIIAGPFGGALGTRIGPAVVLRIGVVLLGVAAALLALVHGASWTIYAWMTLFGVGIAFSFASLGALVIANSAAHETGVATGMNTIMRTVGAALGAQIAAAVISSNTIAGTDVPLERAFTIAFAMGAGGALVALVPTLLLRSRPRVAAV